MKTINLRWMYPHYRHDEFVDVTDEVWAAMYQAQREMENYERRKVYHRAYYSLDAYSWLENYALEHSRSPEDILLEREEMTTRLHMIAALPAALAHATPTQTRRVHAYYIAGIKQPEISRREGIHSSKGLKVPQGIRSGRERPTHPGRERRLEEPPGGHHRLERQRECGDLAGGMGGLHQPGIGGRRSSRPGRPPQLQATGN